MNTKPTTEIPSAPQLKMTIIPILLVLSLLLLMALSPLAFLSDDAEEAQAELPSVASQILP